MNAIRWTSMVMVAALLASIGLAPQAAADPPPAPLATLLNKLPGDGPQIRTQLLELEAADIRALCTLVVAPPPPGETYDEDTAHWDTQARFALHGLALAVGSPDAAAQRTAFAQIIGDVLSATPPPADGVFLIDRLALCDSSESVDVLGDALANEAWFDAAIRALLAIGGPNATRVLREHLDDARGPQRIALIDALSELGDRTAVPTLLADATATDRPLRLAALAALARIGDPRAVRVLLAASQTDDWYDRVRGTDLLLTFAGNLADNGEYDDAAAIYRGLLHTRMNVTETHVRCAAVHGLATRIGLAAVDDVLETLADANPQVRAAAIDAAVAMPGEGVTEAYRWAFESTMDSRRAGILHALARRGDSAALDIAQAATTDSDKDVRIAATIATGILGGLDAIPPLLLLFSGDQPDELAATHQALVDIPGDEATNELLAWLGEAEDMMSDGSPRVAVHLLGVLAARPPTGNVAPVLDAARSEKPALRLAALEALAALAGPGAVPELLVLLEAAEAAEEQAAAAKAVLAAGRRGHAPDQAAGLVLASLERATQAGNSALRCALLGLLGHLGGPGALTAVETALADDAAEIREAAVRALGDWPTDEPAALTLKLARDVESTKLHVLALRAYIRLVGLDQRRPVERTLEMYAAALEAARRTEERGQILAKLGEIRDPGALRLLEPRLADDALRAEAAAAMLNIVEAFIPDHVDAAREPLTALLATNLPPALHERAERAREHMNELEGHITDWWVAGPYQQRDRAGTEVFDTVFPPEDPAATGIDWRRQPVSDTASWQINLHATMPGDNRAGYLFTRLYSPDAQPAQLEVGSDDGIKVWLNGQVVHANNALRGVGAAQDRIAISLQAGWNTLLLKVTNDDGGWAACARVRAPDGGPLPSVRAEAGDKP